MKRMTKRTSIVATVTVAGVLVTGGVAFAYWSSNGTGTGSAAAGTTTNVTVNQSGSVTGLYPGGTPQDVNVTITNPDAGDVKLARVDVAVVSAPAGCNVADFTIGGGATNIVVPGAGTTSPVVAGTIKLENTTSNQDACKSGSISLGFTAVPAA